VRIVVGDILVECVQSDVDNQSDIAALFYYAAKSGEIAAGQEPLSKSELRPGQALLEQLPGFPGRYRIIASGPDSLDDRLAVEVFKCCLVNAVALCENHEVRSVAFPLAAGMSRKIPIPLAARIAAAVVADHAPPLSKSPCHPFRSGKRPGTEHPAPLPHPSRIDACRAQISVHSMKI